MPDIKKNSQADDFSKIRNIGDKIKMSDIYYDFEDALEVAKEFPELEKGVLAILKEDYGVTE